MRYKNKRKGYYKDDRELTTSAKILLFMFTAVDLLPRPFESKTKYFNRTFRSQYVPYKTYLNALDYLERKGFIKIFKDAGKQYVSLTKNGALETLFLKAEVKSTGQWDGKWRLVIFDIPEDCRDKRNQLRRLLKVNGFKKIQASVFINPFPFNREAISYLKKSGLFDYIRIMRVDEMDDDAGLKKAFNLK